MRFVLFYVGEFLPSFAQLEGLRQLLAGSNYFRAVHALPPSLLHLDLSKNAFEGELAHWLLSLKRLQYLSLGDNSFNGTIDAVSNLTQLTELYMGDNSFHGTIDAVRNLTQLKELSLSENWFNGTIDAVRNLTQLTAFSLGANSFNGTINAVSSLIAENLKGIGSEKFLNLKRLETEGNVLRKMGMFCYKSRILT